MSQSWENGVSDGRTKGQSWIHKTLRQSRGSNQKYYHDRANTYNEFTMKIPEWPAWRLSSAFKFNFEQMQHNDIAFSLLLWINLCSVEKDGHRNNKLV